MKKITNPSLRLLPTSTGNPPTLSELAAGTDLSPFLAGPTLADSMAEAWVERGTREATFLNAAAGAPALFKPEAVKETSTRYLNAGREYRRWSA